MSALAIIAVVIAGGFALVLLGAISDNLTKIAVALDELRTIERHRYAREASILDGTDEARR